MSRSRSRLILALAAGAIGIATLTPGSTGGIGVGSTLCMFCGSRGLADFLSNVLLFAPFGAAIGLLTGSRFVALATGVLFSLSIEAAQVTLVAGRDANAGDLVANGLGTLLGWWLCRTYRWWLRGDATWRRAFAVTSAMLIALLAGLSLMAPSLPQRPYYLQWTAQFDGMQKYEGRVLSTRIGALDLPGPWLIDDSDRVRDLLMAGAPLAFSVAAGRPPTRTAPIVSIYDDWQREVVLIAANGHDLIFRYRTRAEELRLDHGELRVENALRNTSKGARMRIAVQKERNTYCIEVDNTATCDVGFTVGDTWMLLTSPSLKGYEQAIAGMLWLLCLFVPSGFLAGTRRSTVISAAAIALVLGAGPYLIGFGWTPPQQVAAALTGVAVGLLLRASRARQASTLQKIPARTGRDPAHTTDPQFQRIP